MKTAMQELIEKLNICGSITNAVSNYAGEQAIAAAIKLATDMLEAEKKQIVNAHISGQKFAFDNDLPDSEEYYNETFNK